MEKQCGPFNHLDSSELAPGFPQAGIHSKELLPVRR